MCGICGMISYSKKVQKTYVQTMVEKLIHRGPDYQDIYIHNNCCLGHTRLSIIDLSESGHQPMTDNQERYYIVFNGEIYNFLELRNWLTKNHDIQFKSRTDTEVVLYLYIKYGPTCLNYLSGMFAFAIWDKYSKSLFLARDRIGKKPLFYASLNDCFIFASELNALMTYPSIAKEIDPKSLDIYLNLQYIPAPYSIYKNVHKLIPAHYLIVSRNKTFLKPYWTLNYYENKQISIQEAKETLFEKIRLSVKKRMISDVPIGVLLSGGVDSSLVAAMMCQLSDTKVKTFSIGFHEQEFNELLFARKVANYLKTDHHEYIVRPNIVELIPEIIRQYGEPFADTSALPSFAVSKIARQHVTVVLNGDGGDELLGGYPRYEHLLFTNQMDFLLKSRFLDHKKLQNLEHAVTARTFLKRIKRKYLLSMKFPEFQEIMGSSFWIYPYRQLLWNKDYLDNMNETFNWKKNMYDQSCNMASKRVNRMLWILNKTYLPYDLLVKMDIASMAYGLEARSPLLDYELIEFCAQLPVKYKIFNNQGKYLLKLLTSKLVPKEVVYRKKHGFSVPISYWLRGSLKNYIKTITNEKKTFLGQFFNMNTVHKIFNEHMSGEFDHGYRLWSLLVLCLWSDELT